MGNTAVEIQKIIFDVSDPQITNVRVEVKWSGEYLLGTKSVYEKLFPARISAIDILQNQIKDYLTW